MRLALLVAVSWGLAVASAAAEERFVVHAAGRDDATAREVVLSLEPAEARAVGAVPTDAHALAELASGLGDDALVVVLDGGRGDVHAVRAGDGLVVSRHVGVGMFARSAYAVSVVAHELATLVADAPRSEVGASAEIPVRRSPVPGEAEAAEDGVLALAPSVELGAGLDAGLGHGPTSFAAHAAIGATLLAGPWRIDLSVLGALHGEHSVTVAATDLGDGDVRYRRIDAALRASLGHIEPAVELWAELFAGLGLARAQLVDAGGNVRTEHDASGPYLGLGVAMRKPIGFGVSVGLSLAVDWAASPTRYLLHGSPVLEEGRLRGRSSVDIRWSNGL